jgi:hypothetical protein
MLVSFPVIAGMVRMGCCAGASRGISVKHQFSGRLSRWRKRGNNHPTTTAAPMAHGAAPARSYAAEPAKYSLVVNWLLQPRLSAALSS